MAGNVWVLAETWRGQVSETTYELLALGRELAAELGVPLQAVLLGHQVKSLTPQLGAAESVVLVDHPALAEPALEPYTYALAQLVKARQPRCLLDGGKVGAPAAASPPPALFGILPGSRPAEKGRGEKAPAVEEVPVELAEAARVKFKKYLEPEAGDIDITQQAVLVSVGRGIQNQDNLALAEELAAAPGGAVSGSRPVIDQGWLPLSRQVGKSGASVKPKLYLALGISGGPEHQGGVRNSELIVAVNTDPGAPIFAIAHFGVCADSLDIVPALTEEIKRRKASRAA